MARKTLGLTLWLVCIMLFAACAPETVEKEVIVKETVVVEVEKEGKVL